MTTRTVARVQRVVVQAARAHARAATDAPARPAHGRGVAHAPQFRSRSHIRLGRSGAGVTRNGQPTVLRGVRAFDARFWRRRAHAALQPRGDTRQPSTWVAELPRA